METETQITEKLPLVPDEKRERYKAISDLSGFTGTECYYKYMFGVVITDGVRYVAEKAGCFWLLDLIASDFNQRNFERTFYRLDVFEDRTFRLMRSDGDNEYELVLEYHYTDFPMPEFRIWAMDGVLMLPSEY